MLERARYLKRTASCGRVCKRLTRDHLGQEAAHALAASTATVLIDHDQMEAAFGVLVEIGSIAPAVDVMRQLAEHYAVNGQIDLLLRSIGELPATSVRKNAWLCFWAGQALLRISEHDARAWFASAYSAFEACSDTFGMRLAAASVVTAFGLEWGMCESLTRGSMHTKTRAATLRFLPTTDLRQR